MTTVLIALALVSLGCGQSQAPSKETLLQKLLRIAGLTASPSQMRAPGDIQPGDIWIAEPGNPAVRALTDGGMYRSPVFEPGDRFIYALRQDVVVRMPTAGGAPVDRGRIPGAVKIIGFDGADDLVVLIEPTSGASPVVVLSLATGRLVPLPHNPGSRDENSMLAFVRGSERVYGDTSVYTRRQSREGLSRKIEWTDVYLARGAAEAVNVSMCDGVNCGDPALSHDGRLVAFVKSALASR